MLATFGSNQSHQTYKGDKLLKIELCTITCTDVSFRVQRDVVKSEIRYITLLKIRDFQYSNEHVVAMNLQSIVYTGVLICP
jgi:hypothetical protein